MTRQIAGVFGVPVALLGLGSADAAKYASNYVESRLSYWQDTVVPCYLIPIAAGMTQSICPPGARICFDLDAVPALWEGRANLGKTISQVTFLSNNEKREILGFEPMAGEDKLPVDAPAVMPPPEETRPPQDNGGRALQ
jgi:phage portal protein BeeE